MNALIFCHTRPDGDTLGSANALRIALDNIGIKSKIVCDGEIPDKYQFLDLKKHVFSPREIKGNYDCHISVDVASESMLGYSFGIYNNSTETFNIDHHTSNEKYARFNYVDCASSNCENIYNLIKAMNIKITAEIADSLLLGIVSDTGNFFHSNVTSQTLNIASDLLRIGGDLHKISYLMFKNQSKNRALLQARVTSKLQFFHEDQLVIMPIMLEDLNATGSSSSMTEGMIDFPLSIDTVEVAISILETKENFFKLSFRSKGKVNVNAIANTYGGGGHILASGCVIKGDFQEELDKLINLVKKHLV